MQWLKRLIILVLALLILICGYWIAVENTAVVNLVLFGFAMPPLALGLVMALTLLAGVILGCIVSLAPIVRLSLVNKAGLKRERRYNQELSSLRESAADKVLGS